MTTQDLLVREPMLAPAPVNASDHTSDHPFEGVTLTPRRVGIVRAIATGLSAGLLALVIALAVLVIVVPRATGSTTLTVLTGSMEPKLPPGTLLVVKPEPIDSIRVGQIVTYEPNPNDAATVISHRVIAITSATDGSRVFTVKGDANNVADAPVRAKQVVAVVWYSVPLLGWVNKWVSGTDRSWLVPAFAVLLFGYAAWMFIAGAADHRRRRRQMMPRSSAARTASSRRSTPSFR